MSHSHNLKSGARPHATARIILAGLADIADMAAWFPCTAHTLHALPSCAHTTLAGGRSIWSALAPRCPQRQLVWARVCNTGRAALVARMHHSRISLNRDHKMALALLGRHEARLHGSHRSNGSKGKTYKWATSAQRRAKKSAPLIISVGFGWILTFFFGF